MASHTVGIVVVSHSSALAEGLAELAREMAGPAVPIEPAGGRADGGLGTDEARVREAIARAGGGGGGVVVLGDLGSSILSVRHLIRAHSYEGRGSGHTNVNVRQYNTPFSGAQ